MSILATAEAEVNDVVAGSVPAEAEAAMQAATPPAVATEFDDEKKSKKNRDAIADIASRLVVVIDPKTALSQYAAIGKRTLEHAIWQKGNFRGEYLSKDFRNLCGKIEDEVKIKVAIDSVRVATYVRLYCWVSAVRTLVGDLVDSLSYHTIVNHFLKTLSFSESNLVGEIRPEWTDWLKETIQRQTGSSPMSFANLKAAIAVQEKAIADAKLAALSPEKVLERESAKVRAERVKAENKAREQISTGIYDALSTGILNPEEVSGIIGKVLTDTKVKLPGLSGESKVPTMMELARTLTGEQASELVRCMMARNNIEGLASMMSQLDKLAPMLRPHLQTPAAAVA